MSRLTACRATEDEPYCCHNCRWHAPDHSHPMTDGGRLTERRGWVCMADEFDCVISGWPYHSLCEMWEIGVGWAEPAPFAVSVRLPSSSHRVGLR